jgi:nucleoside-diphosphate-sugar epimerase
MKVLVTGASGYIGSAVSDALSRAGHHVLGLVRSADPGSEKARALARAGVEPVAGSMEGSTEETGSWIDRAAACRAVVHCAAEPSRRFHELDRRTVEAVLAAQTSTDLPRSFVYTSGVWVYGDTKGARVDESSPLNAPALVAPRVETEKIVLAANRGKQRTIVLRPGCVYGGRGGLPGAWFESAVRSGAARFVGDGSSCWSMIHVEDLAELYRLALESAIGGEVLNATDRSRSTVRDCARAASAAAGAKGAVATIPPDEASRTFGPVAECLAFDQHVDSSQAVLRLGWQPRHSGFVDEAERCWLAWNAGRG